METELLHKYHNEFGYFGVNKTCALLQETYWFPKMKEKVNDHIKNYKMHNIFKIVGKNRRFYAWNT